MIDRELGRGGMGVVYLADDKALDRKVAIKLMRPEITGDLGELDVIMSEARLVAALKHPNIVEIYHVFTEGGQVHLVFEFVSGKTLDQRLKDETALKLSEAADTLRQLAEGLDYAHSKKIIHRDLKPSNIMYAPDGTVKLMDFGLAHRARVTVAQQTRAEAWGTPPYMAPEQEVGTVSKESDLYALGAMLYEMLTGESVFTGPNFLVQKREMIYEPPSKAKPGLPPALDGMIRKALQPEPADRFHSAKELYQAFTAAIEA